MRCSPRRRASGAGAGPRTRRRVRRWRASSARREFGGGRLHARQVFAVDEQRGERDEGRVAQVPAVAYLLLEEALVVLRAGVAQRVVVRVVGLNQDAAGQARRGPRGRRPA